jgi:hypothetical protein
MELLFKREQTTGKLNRVAFKLWGKLEISEDEQALINRYRFDEAVLIGSDDSHLMRGAIKRSIVVFVLASLVFSLVAGMLGPLLGAAAGVGAGYWYIMVATSPVTALLIWRRKRRGWKALVRFFGKSWKVPSIGMGWNGIPSNRSQKSRPKNSS